MPIRLNLLAEAQAAEDQRRRDPVKRAIWLGVFLVILMLFWSGGLQVKAMMSQRDLDKVHQQMTAITNQYQVVQGNRKKVNDIRFKLEALEQLATNRFLHGNLLNALQQTTVDEAQLTHLRADQNYVFVEGTKPRTNDNRVTPGRPSTWTEKITLTLEGHDTSPTQGDQAYKYKDAIGVNPYFALFLDRTNPITLKNLGKAMSPDNAREITQFTLECRYPEKTR